MLGSDDAVTRQRTLVSLSALLHTPEKVASAIEADIVAGLQDLLHDDWTLAREKAAHALAQLALTAIGREVLAEHGIFADCADLFGDESLAVRAEAHAVVRNAVQTPEGAIAVIAAGVVPDLKAKVAVEEDEVQIAGLQSLHACLRQDPYVALEETEAGALSAVDVLTALLQHTNTVVVEWSAKCIMALAFCDEGKAVACEAGAVEALVGLVEHAEPPIRAAALGALMAITVDIEGKDLALAAGLAPLLEVTIHDVSDLSWVIRLNTIKVANNVGEHPIGRKELRPLLEPLDAVAADVTDQTLARAAAVAMRTISWRP